MGAYLSDTANYVIRSLVSVFILAILLSLIVLSMWGCPKWNVYRKELSGKAQLKEAQWNRQITIEEAQAELEAAFFKKQSDSVRAVGTAISNEIIAKSLSTEYIQWKWVEGLNDGNSETIYVPTEANLPILEATRKMK